MRIHYNSDLYLQTNDIKEIKKWWEKRCYSHEDAVATKKVKKNIDVDPLGSVK